MYKEFYFMKKEPFDSHPSPELFYKSDGHQNGWNYLVQGIKKSEPNLLVTGNYGAGKTLLYLKLIKLFEKNSHLPAVSISTPAYNFIMLLEKILVELGISVDGIDTSDESRLQQAIHEYFEKRKAGEKRLIYVVIDDAQEFSYSFINKLRLFASYNCSGYFPIKIILFAHPYFLKMLNYKKMAAFGQRIKRIYSLRPLNFEETREYIYFRLIHSGATGSPVFDDEAIRFIQTISKGNPRLINNICDNCLLAASSERSNLINLALVNEAMEASNLMGLEEIQKQSDSAAAPHKIPQSVPVRQSPVSDKPAFEKTHPKAANQNYRQTGQKLPKDEIHTRYAQNREFRNRAPEEPEIKEKKKSNLKNFKSRYGKIGVIILLAFIALFLLFYLLNQRQSNERFNLQGSVIEKSASEPLYTVENQNLSNKNKTMNNFRLHEIVKQGTFNIENGYQPIIFMENLM